MQLWRSHLPSLSPTETTRPLGQASKKAMTQAGNAAQPGKRHPLAEDFVDYGRGRGTLEKAQPRDCDKVWLPAPPQETNLRRRAQAMPYRAVPSAILHQTNTKHVTPRTPSSSQAVRCLSQGPPRQHEVKKSFSARRSPWK